MPQKLKRLQPARVGEGNAFFCLQKNRFFNTFITKNKRTINEGSSKVERLMYTGASKQPGTSQQAAMKQACFNRALAGKYWFN